MIIWEPRVISLFISLFQVLYMKRYPNGKVQEKQVTILKWISMMVDYNQSSLCFKIIAQVKILTHANASNESWSSLLVVYSFNKRLYSPDYCQVPHRRWACHLQKARLCAHQGLSGWAGAGTTCRREVPHWACVESIPGEGVSTLPRKKGQCFTHLQRSLPLRWYKNQRDSELFVLKPPRPTQAHLSGCDVPTMTCHESPSLPALSQLPPFRSRHTFPAFISIFEVK